MQKKFNYCVKLSKVCWNSTSLVFLKTTLQDKITIHIKKMMNFLTGCITNWFVTISPLPFLHVHHPCDPSPHPPFFPITQILPLHSDSLLSRLIGDAKVTELALLPFEEVAKPCGLLEGRRCLLEIGRLPRLLAITIPEWKDESFQVLAHSKTHCLTTQNTNTCDRKMLH